MPAVRPPLNPRLALPSLVMLAALALGAGCTTTAVPPTEAQGPVLPPPMAPNDTTVFDDIPPGLIADRLSPGWNLGNQLEGVKMVTDATTGTTVTWPSETGYQSTRISNELLAAVKAAGFRFVRIPVSYFAMIDDADGYSIDPQWLGRIKAVVDMCIANGLYCMINMHGDGYTTIRNAWLLCAAPDQKPIQAKYAAVWKQVAETFRDYDESLMFESMNEEFDGSYDGPKAQAYENLNAYNEIFVKTVRGTGGNNAKRWLLVPGWNTDIDQTIDGMGTAGHFRMPKDNRIMVSVHYYEPWGFCGGENGTATQWGSFTADPSRANGTEAAMAIQFNKLAAAFTSKKIPVVVGEWGSIDKSADDPASPSYRAWFARKLTENALRTGCVPAYWDNGWNGTYGFALFNRGTPADKDGNIVPGTVAVTQQGIINAIMGVYARTILQFTPARVSIDKSSLVLEMGSTATLKARVSKGGPQDVVDWVSTDETVAVVKDGRVVPIGPGYCYIKAVLTNGSEAQCDLTIKAVEGILAKVYLFEGAGWSSVQSIPLIIRPGVEQRYEVTLSASSLVLENIAAFYLKDIEVEEKHAISSSIASSPITVEGLWVNGVRVPLVRNVAIEAVNAKGQFDLPVINEWSAGVEMIDGLPKGGHRNLGTAVKGLVLRPEGNEVTLRFSTLKGGGTVATAAAEPPAPPTIEAGTSYHAWLGIQAADSWVFRNSWHAGTYGAGTPEFTGGLFDTENPKSSDGHVPGVITDATFTGADLMAGRPIELTLTDFDLSDQFAVPKALNVAIISTDIPFGTVEVTSAKLYFDGVQVNLKDGKDAFAVDIENFKILVTFINIWQTGLKTFGYPMPAKSVRMVLECRVK